MVMTGISRVGMIQTRATAVLSDLRGAFHERPLGIERETNLIYVAVTRVKTDKARPSGKLTLVD